ncbi:hypothetical protein Lbir_2699 [Legionella birminghamensis]|uniref:Protein of uncharacterized function (DUF763) n=1 Tax=Legionella birminghamensis TaxID=28083 RepID=A0A378I819_9GAMM|nr:DUF763 domain-containing protein [Legionella birminghamensis]KTC68097.1 hypothetical protein Lbir_2699 [Legionella birminghamensis]STX31193.1 Protein of uncharacterised function (DUF763) [Legionella birminghamensis]
MAQKTGSANLPLHYGRVPLWLAERMAKLAAVMTQAICAALAEGALGLNESRF